MPHPLKEMPIEAYIWGEKDLCWHFSKPIKSLSLFDDHLEIVSDKGSFTKKTSPLTWWKDLQELLSPDELWVGYLAYDLVIPLYQLAAPPARDEPLAFFFQPQSTLNEAVLPPESQPTQKLLCASSAHGLQEAHIHLLSDFKQYAQAFERIKGLIGAGDLYQINLTYESIATTDKTPWQFFLNMVGDTPPPFSSFITFSTHTIASASPELFIRMEDFMLETRPMKGTQQAALDPLHLEKSTKEQAELAMITDLMRNDLLAISKPGSIRVVSPPSQAVYGNIRQQFSVIRSELKEKTDHPLEHLQKIFPGGSVTGCPKRRACERIYEIEKRRRGVYTGAIGFWDRGRWHWNMAIRTATFHHATSKISYSVGGGITWNSQLNAEWQESHLKLEPLLKGLRPRDKSPRDTRRAP